MTQCNRILDHLQRNGSITTMGAYKRYGITRLSGRIWDLRKAGHKITSTITEGVNREGDKTYFSTCRLEATHD